MRATEGLSALRPRIIYSDGIGQPDAHVHLFGEPLYVASEREMAMGGAWFSRKLYGDDSPLASALIDELLTETGKSADETPDFVWHEWLGLARMQSELFRLATVEAAPQGYAPQMVVCGPIPKRQEPVSSASGYREFYERVTKPCIDHASRAFDSLMLYGAGETQMLGMLSSRCREWETDAASPVDTMATMLERSGRDTAVWISNEQTYMRFRSRLTNEDIGKDQTLGQTYTAHGLPWRIHENLEDGRILLAKVGRYTIKAGREIAVSLVKETQLILTNEALATLAIPCGGGTEEETQVLRWERSR